MALLQINLYGIAYPVTSLGPGRRLVIWLAGCKKRCEGCISPEMQDASSGRLFDVNRFLERILKLNMPLDGVTISGGEPFDQAEALCELLEGLAVSRPEWNVIAYTGYKFEELEHKGCNILEKIDVLIDGEYIGNIQQMHPLAGSGNQRVHYLTSRGRKIKPEIEAKRLNELNFGLMDSSRKMIIGIKKTNLKRGEVNESEKNI